MPRSSVVDLGTMAEAWNEPWNGSWRQRWWSDAPRWWNQDSQQPDDWQEWHGQARQWQSGNEWSGSWSWPPAATQSGTWESTDHDQHHGSWYGDGWQEVGQWQGEHGWSGSGSDARGGAYVSNGDTTATPGATSEPSPPDPLEPPADDKDSNDLDSSKTESRKPRTGKEHVPSYDGKSEPMREYQRRVKIYVSTTGTDPEYRAGRLLEQLTGAAWRATETLDLEDLRRPDGVDRLLEHLWQELEPLEHLRVFTTLQSFYRNFRRQRGEEFVAFDTRFRVQLQRLEEIGAGLNGVTKSFWFLEAAGLSNDLRKQVVAAAGGAYEYPKLRAALMAIVPQVVKDEEGSVFSGDRKHQAHRRPTGSNSHRVNMVAEEGAEGADHEEQEGAGDEDEGGEVSLDPEEAEATADALEREAEVMVTQAAKRRSQAERARGFQKVETDASRSARIASMKERMPCSECKSRGKLVYGHWHSDPTCPYYGKNKNVQDKKDKKDDRNVFVVTQQADDDEDSENGDEDVYTVMMVEVSGEDMGGIAMSDTCCAKSVAGTDWMIQHLQWMDQHDISYHIMEEMEAFRFGPGRRIHSDFAVIMPAAIAGSKVPALVRVSVVPQKVPLLVSRGVLQGLGAILYMSEGKVDFQKLKCQVDLVNTPSGHVGFAINDAQVGQVHVPEEIWQGMLSEKSEVKLGACNRTGFEEAETNMCNHTQSTWEPHNRVGNTGSKSETHVQHLASAETSVFESTWPARQHEQDVGAKGEGGLCQPDRSSLCSPRDRAEGAHGRPFEADLDAGQTSETGVAIECRLEEERLGDTSVAIPRAGGAGSLQVHGGSPLEGVETISIHPGVGSLVQGQGAGDCTPWRRHAAERTNVQELPVASYPSDQPTHKRGFLGLYPLPHLQANVTAPLRQPACGSSAKGLGRRGEAEGAAQEERIRQDWGRQIWEGLCTSSGNLRDGILERAQWFQHRGHGGEGRRGSVGGHELDSRGGCKSAEGAQVQAVASAESGHEGVPEDSDDPEIECEEPVLRDPSEIKATILKGQRHRKHMRQGTLRRLLGNAKRLVSSVMMVAGVMAVSSGAFISTSLARQQPDIVEVFGGQAQVSLEFSRWGWHSAEPIDQIYGQDLRNPDERARVLKMIRDLKPRLAIIAYPCTLWGPLARINYTTSQEKRRLRQHRDRERPFLELCEEIFCEQLREGRDALGENPLCSESFKEKPIANILRHPEVYAGVGHGCRFGIKNARTGERLYKPTLWFSTSKEICDELSKRCENETKPGHHTHGKCMGGKHVTSHAGVYTKEIATAVHKGYVRLLKRKSPGYLKQVVRDIQRRIRFGDSDKNDLRWSEKSIHKIIQQWNAVYAVDNPVPEDQQAPDVVRNPDTEPTGVKLHDENIRFEVPRGRKLEAEVRSALRKLHCNLGHPQPRDFERFLRLGGARQEIVEASHWLRCTTCEHSKRPKAHRRVSIPPNQCVFGDEVALDCFHIHDSRQKGYWFLSVVDRATSFHMVGFLQDHSPQNLQKVFDDVWCKWAGVPNRVSVDCEGGFGGEPFWKEVGEGMTAVVSIAGTAHWQAGKVERHNQTIKRMLESTIRHSQVVGEEDMKRCAREAVQAKNELVREHGWSPNILVFGREPRAFGEILSQGNPVAYHPNAGTGGSEVARRVKYRFHARLAFLRSQVRDMMGRTLEQRTRKLVQPQQGQLVFFWREARHRRKQNPCSNWVGPGFVVGVQGTNAWVSCAGRCFLVASEHLRLAVGDEEEYGTPEAQQALALFRRPPKDSTYEDLTGQKGPDKNSLDVSVDDDFLRDILEDEDDHVKEIPRRSGVKRDQHVESQTRKDNQFEQQNVPGDIRNASRKTGWTQDALGNPVFVRRHAVTFELPTGPEGRRLPKFRTTWGFTPDYVWKRFEDEVDWTKMDSLQEILPETPVVILVTLFSDKRRKEWCLESLPSGIKKKIKTEDHDIFVVSKQKAKRMIEKEIPYNRIALHEKQLFHEAEVKEWTSWKQFDTVEALSEEEARKIQRDQPERILKSRWVYRNKHAGMYDQGVPLPTKAKARLCVMGQFAPGVVEGTTPVDSPTVQRVSTLYFLHCILCWGWTATWAVGDVSNAFLQGERPKGDDLFMSQPERGLPDVADGVIFRLKKSVYGLCDAPKMWYESLCNILTKELPFQKSLLDPALFVLYDETKQVCGLLVTHVDDIMFATNGSQYAQSVIDKLHTRLPFGEWQKVSEQKDGVSYCGRELRIEEENGEQVITVSQRAFIDGRLEEIEIGRERKKNPEYEATQGEKTDFRSTVGSLQWLSTQSRPDLSFEVNQLQKRIPNLQVADLIRANRIVKEAKANPFHITLRNIGNDWDLVVFHDAGLFNSVGVEIDEQTADDALFKSTDKKLVYSQKGAVVGFVKKGDRCFDDQLLAFNLLDWKSSTNKRVIESSFAAETQAALMGQGLGKYVQALSTEILHGSDTITKVDDAYLEEIQPMIMVTDCKSLYDAVHKQAQHISDKGSVISLVLIRQICETRTDDQIPSRKAQILWVPTHCQIADSLTKGGRGKALREANWLVKLRGESLKSRQSQKKLVSV